MFDVKMPPKKRARVNEGAEASGPRRPSAAGRSRSAAGPESMGPPVCSRWLMKSEPESRLKNGVDVKFGIEDLKALPDQTGCWDGVRSYQARNFIRQMKAGQLAFFYHSNCKEPGIAGIMEVVKEAYGDPTQFDRKDVNYDASSRADEPKWSAVDVRFRRMTRRFLPLSELKRHHLQHRRDGGPLKDVALFTRARLSVQPLTSEEFDFILSLEDKEPQ
ncbi:thymocyte nuclear protein 1 isoform X1 [Kryptolebias marmoratus]|uniref:thymocyte nuclear protein 1 isoform X1 n=1 Tax=Kryptolebias marmoratus TaxID=37003 RepID=UPI000D53009E|nr:thymocyte nuclear protein 1 isoform X1 [Kryptolebias marmoratus]